MKNKYLNLIMVVLLIMSIVSCKTLITKYHLNLKKGSTLATFKKEEVDFDIKVNLDKLAAKHKAKFEVYMATMPGATSREVYYYAFRNDSLLYWGHPFQFTRHENQQIREIGEEAHPFAVKEYDLKIK